MDIVDEIFDIEILIELEQIFHIGRLKGDIRLSLKVLQSTAPEVVEPRQGTIFSCIIDSSLDDFRNFGRCYSAATYVGS